MASGVVVPERTGMLFRQTFWGRNGVPVVIRPPRWNTIAAAFRQMFAVKIRFAYSEIRPCLMYFALLNDAALIAIPQCKIATIIGLLDSQKLLA